MFDRQKSFEGFKARSAAFNAMANVEKLDLGAIMTTAPIYSSIGDLGRLGLLESFRPSARNDTLTVDEVDFSARNLMPCPYNVSIEYDERFHLRVTVGKKFAFGEMGLRLKVVKDLFDALI